jgi:branched-subunit amino acid aminotransferase/4-amino-4-deoxychorismate lyase
MDRRMEIDGRTAHPDAWQALDLGFGHFTAMQVRDGRTRGLDLHLARLDAANREIFVYPLDADLVRERIRHALGGTRDASVRVYAAETSIVVTVRDPGHAPAGPQRLRSVRYQRPLAHLKHLGGFAPEYHRRAAQRDGYDEVLLVTDDGTISEGGITNLACWDGTALVWPDAPHLAGITMQLLRQALPWKETTLNLADLPRAKTVFVTNARGIAAVAQVDDVPLPVDESLTKTLIEVYDAVPWDPI